MTRLEPQVKATSPPAMLRKELRLLQRGDQFIQLVCDEIKADGRPPGPSFNALAALAGGR